MKIRVYAQIQRWSRNDYFRCFFTKCELTQRNVFVWILRSSHPEEFLGKGVLKICSKVTREQPYWSAISIKLLCNFIEIPLRHGFAPINLLYIFRIPFPRSNSGWLLLKAFSALHCLVSMFEKQKTCNNNKGKSFGALMTDLSKAFDYLSHELIITKLHTYSFDQQDPELSFRRHLLSSLSTLIIFTT